MRRRTLGPLVLLATLSVAGVVSTQVVWLKRAQQYEREQVTLQQQHQEQLDKQFNDRVVIALTEVTERILSITKDPSDLFDAVKQERPNYFVASINDTIHPYLLESLLEQEFRRRNINEDFEYGIYDCFTDSIVYGNYVSVGDTMRTDSTRHSHLLKLDKDGHYFGVFFPRRTSALWAPAEGSTINWIYPAVVTFIVFAFFVYSMWVILRQKRLDEMKNDFIGNMTHELKTPISTIALSSAVLTDPDIVKEPDRLHTYAKIIQSENERLRQQVERVLQLATMETGESKLRMEPVDVHELLRETVGSFGLILTERSGECTLDLRAGNAVVQGDRVHLGNVLFNLVDNAVKYSKEAPRLRIATRNAGQRLEVSIADRGIGIRKEDLRNIFERFFRVHTGNVHDVKGFGLGLHYVAGMVRTHGGKVRVESTPGEGSTFTLDLPLAGTQEKTR
ncbi:MAG TPA: HAMP domain-containing sensor histidine kinase [Flavobacteriales bacterium]|nr:HAMP domain-containing sensor histidine kinase [Flavobacteriales bacterium]HRO40565.1 HAMP domain-containing sensor histidine kinase [Flavobacteriales bacterium]HRP80809.1 HAMP domain-containing sensor histidine kinase [Flavobacteriales bacterium]